jgi:hypothetical protein
MPIGPKGEKRPRETNQLAKLMVDLALARADQIAPLAAPQPGDVRLSSSSEEAWARV